LSNFWKTNIYIAKKESDAYSVHKLSEKNLPENCCRHHAFYLSELQSLYFVSLSENGKNAELATIGSKDGQLTFLNKLNTLDNETFPIVSDDEKSIIFIRKKAYFSLQKSEIHSEEITEPKEIQLPKWLREKHFGLLFFRNNKLFFYRQEKDVISIFKANIMENSLVNISKVTNLQGKASGVNYLSCSENAYFLTYSELAHDFEVSQPNGTVRKGIGHRYYTFRYPFDDRTKNIISETENITQIFSLNIHYASGSSDIIEDKDFQFLDSLVLIAQKHDCHVKVSSHTDNLGNEEFNLKLSLQRAEKIANYLVKKGLNPARIESEGYGASMPIFENNNPENKAKNRRTEIFLIKK
jgi:outer membrane protein OmpA-like peptidoglycan-associated protein